MASIANKNTYWKMVLDEVMNKDVPRKVYLTNVPHPPRVIEKPSGEKEIANVQVGGYQFTARECDCLWYAVQGLKVLDIAERLGIAYRTAQEYLNNARAKTGCKTKMQLVSLISKSEFVKIYTTKLEEGC